jgi:hypothetical protein
MIDTIRNTLSAFEETNHGCNHVAEYELHRLPDQSTLSDALDSYFAGQYTSISAPRPDSDWHISAHSLDDPAATLRAALKRWLIEDRPADNTMPTDGLPDVSRLIADMSNSFDLDKTVRVTVRPPLWYGCEWDDFALVADDGFYLLHLGYSD